MRPDVEIDLPVYNEAECLRESVERLRQFLIRSRFRYTWQIVIINNASTDRTLDVAKALACEYKDVAYINLKKKGRGRALREAWMRSRAKVCSYMDIDLSTDLRAFPKLIDAVMKEGYDLSTGSRLMRGSRIKRSIKREILSRVYVFLLKAWLGIKFKDAQCGFKAVNMRIRKEVLPRVLDQEWFFDSELMFKAQRYGYRIKEIPIVWIEDPGSTVRVYKTVRNYLLSMLRIKLEFMIDSVHQ
jgi:glycosyltransferase involved in cell wall biosynthesis